MVCKARVGRMGEAQRGLLRAAHQHPRLGRRDALADLRPAHRGRSRLPHPQKRALDPSDLASEDRARRGAHPGLLPRLRALEDARAVAAPCGAGQQPAHHPRRTRPHPKHRRGAAAGRGSEPKAPHPLPRKLPELPVRLFRASRRIGSRKVSSSCNR